MGVHGCLGQHPLRADSPNCLHWMQWLLLHKPLPENRLLGSWWTEPCKTMMQIIALDESNLLRADCNGKSYFYEVLKSICLNQITCLVWGSWFFCFLKPHLYLQKVGTKAKGVFGSDTWGIGALSMMTWSLNGRDCLIKTSGALYFWLTVCNPLAQCSFTLCYSHF